MYQASHGFAAEIHERPRLGQQQFLVSYFASAYFSPALPLVKADRMTPGEVIQASKANVMATMCISPAGISQTNYEFH